MNWPSLINNRQSEVSRRATSNASSRPDARAEIQRLATEEGACHRSCESKNWKPKKREVRARAPLAPADPYTINILRRAPAWCIFFGIKVIVTLWPAGSAKDSFGSLLPINANLLLCGILGRNRAIYETVGAVVIPFKRIRWTSQALPSNCRQTRSPQDALRMGKVISPSFLNFKFSNAWFGKLIKVTQHCVTLINFPNFRYSEFLF